MSDQPKTQAEISPQEQEFNKYIWAAVSVMVNGLRASIPQAPVPMLMVKMCGALGECVGMVISAGAIGDVLRVRSACVKAFSEGIREAKLQPPTMPNIKMDS